MSDNDTAAKTSRAGRISIRQVSDADMAGVVTLDERVTGVAKPDYWRDIFERYATRGLDHRFFLVAEDTKAAKEGATTETDVPPLLGYIVGEVRGWEFGSEPCGWIFAFSVEPNTRQRGVGEHLFQAMSGAFKSSGIKTMRTMVARQNRLHMAFFRSEGMVAGPYIQLEMDIEEDLAALPID